MALGCCDEASGIDCAEESLQATLQSSVGFLTGNIAQGVCHTATFDGAVLLPQS